MDIEEEYVEDTISPNDGMKDSKDDDPSGGFDCNICLEPAEEPVVTLCGHLYCWPCIYKWLTCLNISSEEQHKQCQQCPVCKSQVSRATLVPLYGRGQTKKPSKGNAPDLGIIIPRRSVDPTCGVSSPISPDLVTSPYRNPPHHYYSRAGSSRAHVLHDDPAIGVYGDVFHARLFGNSITNLYAYPNSYSLVGSTSPRIRRHMMLLDESLSRMSFFLFCCLVLCLLFF